MKVNERNVKEYERSTRMKYVIACSSVMDPTGAENQWKNSHVPL
jgi:hypothetical protein